MNTTMVTTVRATTVCIAAILGFNAAAAFAGTPWYDEAAAAMLPKYVVQFQDLDLSRIEGAATLYARLRHAARTVCESIQTQQPMLVEKYRACVDKAIADAVTKVNRPLLSQYLQLHIKGDRAGPPQLAKVH
jgi:UrcA family protein